MAHGKEGLHHLEAPDRSSRWIILWFCRMLKQPIAIRSGELQDCDDRKKEQIIANAQLT
jgi:hypothetical protein